ncbi:hypothetical protein B0T19DRAFT_81059 [Cercophora scortea]|uniref:Uncharacterized protein n=1 Tax=Cercophora scortea TaxID=314031 RepID=A0AAE0J6D7_9PEZI|nr:hypothetical protein B0T19DRAFT_81059 [Cercophora scortea]
MSTPPTTIPNPLGNNQEEAIQDQQQQQPWHPATADIQIQVEGPSIWRTRSTLIPHPVLHVGVSPAIPDGARLTADVKVVDAYGRDVRASLAGSTADVVGVECPTVKPPSSAAGDMRYYYFVFELMYLRAGKYWLHFTVRYETAPAPASVGGDGFRHVLGEKRTVFGCETTLSSPDHASVPGKCLFFFFFFLVPSLFSLLDLFSSLR